MLDRSTAARFRGRTRAPLGQNKVLELSAALLGQAIGVVLWAFVLNAPVLMWRARRMQAWYITYLKAGVVSIKAGLVALIVGNIAFLAAALTEAIGEEALRMIGFLASTISWWFAHSNALLKLAGTSTPLTVGRARVISLSVFSFIFLPLAILGIAVAVIVPMVAGR